jgi:biopolymer transport protein ExbD
MKLARKRHIEKTVELNITAFMNLMVILVPFLLITAVFSRMTVLELNLPALTAKQKQEQQVKLQLELVIRANSFDIQDANLGLIKRFEREQGDTDWNAFTDILVEIKSRFPEADSITLLLERNTQYKTLIQVMDRVRSADIVQVATVETVELFPNISIGDAPNMDAATEAETQGATP